MPLTRIACPECGAGLTSKAGFTPGRTVNCPKCETPFTVEEPAAEEDPPAAAAKKPVRTVASSADDDVDDDRPKKKKKKRRDDDEEKWSYSKSWVRYAVLGVLLTVMIVLAVLLYLKKQREAKDNAQAAPAGDTDDGIPKNPVPLQGQGAFVGVNQVGGGAPKGGTPKGVTPKVGAFVPPAPQNGAGFFDTPKADTPAGQKTIADLKSRLVGSWEGTAPDGAKHSVSYQANGQFQHTSQGPTSGGSAGGQWTVAGLIGTRGLKLTRPGGAKPTVNAVFEGSELIHDTANPGETVVLRKK